MRVFSLLSKSLIGLSIRDDAVLFVQAKKTRSGFLIEKAGRGQLTDGIYQDDQIREWSVFRDVLTELVYLHGLAGQIAAVSLPVRLVSLQHMQVPAGMPQALVEDEIRVQIKRDFPGMEEALYTDFSMTNSEDDVDVYFVVTRQAYVSQYVKAIEACGLQVKIVDIDIYAIARLAAYSLPRLSTSEQTYAVLDLEQTSASLIVFNTNHLLFYQQWHVREEGPHLLALKSRLQMFYASFPYVVLKKLIVNKAYLTDEVLLVTLEQELACEVLRLNYFSTIQCSSKAKKQINTETIHDYLVACGSAMQDRPKW